METSIFLAWAALIFGFKLSFMKSLSCFVAFNSVVALLAFCTLEAHAKKPNRVVASEPAQETYTFGKDLPDTIFDCVGVLMTDNPVTEGPLSHPTSSIRFFETRATGPSVESTTAKINESLDVTESKSVAAHFKRKIYCSALSVSKDLSK
jgi:hypothetical protein